MKNRLLKEIIVWLIIMTGLFVFSILTYIIAVNKGKLFGGLAIYKTVLKESTGLQVGTPVTIHGKNTGNIVKISLLPDGKVEIRFNVRKNHAFSLTKASFTQLKNSGALGDRFINIVTEDLSAEQLKKGSLIPYRESSNLLSLLTGDGGKTKKSLQSILAQIESLLAGLNQKGFGLLPKEDHKNITEILKSVKNILSHVEAGKGTLGALIKDRSLYNRLLVLLGQRPTNNYIQDLSQKSAKPLSRQ